MFLLQRHAAHCKHVDSIFWRGVHGVWVRIVSLKSPVRVTALPLHCRGSWRAVMACLGGWHVPEQPELTSSPAVDARQIALFVTDQAWMMLYSAHACDEA